VKKQIRYLNTDLDLQSEHDLTELGKAFEANGAFPLHLAQEDDGIWYAMIETDESFNDPEQNIDAFLKIIESLSSSIRSDWDGCRLREFNTGYDCGTEPRSYMHRWSHDLLARVVRAGASVAVTLYPLDSEETERLPIR